MHPVERPGEPLRRARTEGRVEKERIAKAAPAELPTEGAMIIDAPPSEEVLMLLDADHISRTEVEVPVA
jgi:hypothetical protein